MTELKLPNGEYTNSPEEFSEVWDDFTKHVRAMSGMKLQGMNPGASFVKDNSPTYLYINLPCWLIHDLNEYIEKIKEK